MKLNERCYLDTGAYFFLQAINLFNVFGQTSMCVFSTFDFTIMWIIVIIRMIGRPDISLVAYILNKMHTLTISRYQS